MEGLKELLLFCGPTVFCNKGNDVHIILTKDTVISYYINSKIKIHILHRGKHFEAFSIFKERFLL